MDVDFIRPKVVRQPQIFVLAVRRGLVARMRRESYRAAGLSVVLAVTGIRR